jgi:hypothetical protein
MALSDQLGRLSAQAKSFEDTVTAFNSDTRQKIADKRAEAKKSLDETRSRIGDQVTADQADFDTSWASLQKSVSDSFDDLNQKLADKRADRAEKRADRKADAAEADAEDAIDFAVYALQEAEYAVLDAAYYRDQAAALAEGA